MANAKLHLVSPEDHGIVCGREKFPEPIRGSWPEAWSRLFAAHGCEVRQRPFNLDYRRYRQIQDDGRLVWIVARHVDVPVGYSAHYWYYDLHFCDEKIAADDLWYVTPEFRCSGVGRQLKQIGLEALRAQGVIASYDLVRRSGVKAYDALAGLGYDPVRIQWKKTL